MDDRSATPTIAADAMVDGPGWREQGDEQFPTVVIGRSAPPPPPPPPPPLPPTLAPVPSAPLVGRADELEQLHRVWRGVVDGGRGVVLIGGAPGAGATRLAAEFARHRHAAGTAVYFGRCDPPPTVAPQPWVMALEHRLRTASPDALDRLADCLGPLAPFMPQLEWILPGVTASLTAEPLVERHRLRAAVVEVLARTGDGSPVVVVLEDLHLGGDETLWLLRSLARDGPVGSLLIVGTFRDAGDGPGTALAATLADLRAVDGVSRIHLGGLDARSVAEMLFTSVDGLGGAELARMATAVAERTGGNALFATELCRHLSAGRRRGGAGTKVIPEVDDVPEGVQEIVSARLAGLPDTAAWVAELVAVSAHAAHAAHALRIEELRIAAGLDDADLERGLRLTVEAGLVVERAGAFPTFECTDTLVRDSVVAHMSALARSRAHLALADAFERIHADDPRPLGTECAPHLVVVATPGNGPHRSDGLTAREVDVLRLVAEGCSNQEIGRRLCISPNTAANHVRSILQKTGCTNRTEAAHHGLQVGLVSLEDGDDPAGQRPDTRVSYSASRTR